MIRAIRAWFSDRRLWQKLLILYLTVSIIPILALSALGAFISADIMVEQVGNRLYDSTKNMAGQMRSKMQLFETALDQLVYEEAFLQRLTLAPRSALFRKELMDDSTRLLGDLQPIAAEVSDVCIVLPDTAQTAGSVISTLDVPGAAAVMEAARRAEYRGQSLLALQGGQEYTYVCRQVINPYSGAEVGIVVLRLDSRVFYSGLSVEGIGEFAFVVQDDAGLNLYTEARLNKAYGGVFPHSLQAADTGELRLMHRTFLYEPYHMDELAWNVCLLVPKDILYEGFSDILLFSLSIALGLIFLVSLFSILISLNLSKRLDSISREMLRVGAGELEVSLSGKENGDEIARLTYIFNEMVNKLNTLIIERYKSELKQQEARLKILQAQINPHFLYNCMDTINWRAIMNGDEKTSAFATNLSDFYRTCLNKGNTKIRMKDEFKNVRAYLRLQEDLHDNSFDVTYDVDERIYDYEGINLILQPVVENALEHGVEQTVGRRGAIRISAALEERDEGKRIVIRLFNTGPPIDPQTARAALAEPGRGYGLANVNSRIQLYFGPEYGVRICPVDQGTLCSIVIPAIRWEPDEQEESTL